MDPLDIDVLRAHILKKDRSWVVAHPEYELSKEQKATFEDFLDRRSAGEPMAYIIGEREFYGRTFFVDARVLIPRPATEGLVEMVIERMSSRSPTIPRSPRTIDSGIVGVFIPKETNQANQALIVDIGTGSGCIAITLACELPNLRIIATDISADALQVAQENARRHGVLGRIEFRQGNLLEPIQDIKEPFIVVSNPPYVSRNIHPPPLPNPPPEGEGIFYEPSIALFAGHKGTDVLKPLMEQARAHPYCIGVFLECHEDQIPL